MLHLFTFTRPFWIWTTHTWISWAGACSRWHYGSLRPRSQCSWFTDHPRTRAHAETRTGSRMAACALLWPRRRICCFFFPSCLLSLSLSVCGWIQNGRKESEADAEVPRASGARAAAGDAHRTESGFLRVRARAQGRYRRRCCCCCCCSCEPERQEIRSLSVLLNNIIIIIGYIFISHHLLISVLQRIARNSTPEAPRLELSGWRRGGHHWRLRHSQLLQSGGSAGKIMLGITHTHTHPKLYCPSNTTSHTPDSPLSPPHTLYKSSFRS